MNKFFKILFMLLCFQAKSQTEYITNGSFEKIDSCYGNTAGPSFDIYEWSGCSGWSNPKVGTPDLWCQGPITWTVVPPAIPTIGFQYPRTGNNMAGIFQGFSTNNSYYGEYIQNKLIATLKKDYLYSIEFYLSKGFSPCTISQIGVKFFNTKYYDSWPYWFINTIPDMENTANNFIDDTLGWQKISLKYKANGSENYMILGGFADSLGLIFVKSDFTLCDSTGGIHPSVYFFIDDVSVIEHDFDGGEILIPNVFTPNDDKSNDVWTVDFSNYKNINCTIYNRWGTKIYEVSTNIIKWDGRTTSGEPCSDGIYFYVLKYTDAKGTEQQMKEFISLFR